MFKFRMVQHRTKTGTIFANIASCNVVAMFFFSSPRCIPHRCIKQETPKDGMTRLQIPNLNEQETAEDGMAGLQSKFQNQG